MAEPLKVGLAGLGTVGSAVVQLIEQNPGQEAAAVAEFLKGLRHVPSD